MAYGQVNADVIGTSVTGSSLGAGNASLMKSRIINGAMVIDQRNGGASITPTNQQYSADRWKCWLSQASKYSIQQNAGAVTPPVGFTNYLGVTSLSAYSVISSDQFSFSQIIEGYNIADLGWGTANAKTVTLSFQVRSSLTGTFGGSITNSATDRSYPFTYTISSANTWTSISVTITGCTDGTWATNNTAGMYIWFGLGVGSTQSGTAGAWANATYVSATGATSVVGTNGATFYITGVQLEVGTSATGFEYRQYQQELALCQRYYWKLQGASGATGYQGINNGQVGSSTTVNLNIPMPVQMRSTPTFSFAGSITVSDTSVSPAVTSVTTTYLGNQVLFVNLTASGGGLTVGRCAVVYTQNASTNYVDFSAEL